MPEHSGSVISSEGLKIGLIIAFVVATVLSIGLLTWRLMVIRARKRRQIRNSDSLSLPRDKPIEKQPVVINFDTLSRAPTLASRAQSQIGLEPPSRPPTMATLSDSQIGSWHVRWEGVSSGSEYVSENTTLDISETDPTDTESDVDPSTRSSTVGSEYLGSELLAGHALDPFAGFKF